MTTKPKIEEALREAIIAQPDVILDDKDVMHALIAANPDDPAADDPRLVMGGCAVGANGASDGGPVGLMFLVLGTVLALRRRRD